MTLTDALSTGRKLRNLSINRCKDFFSPLPNRTYTVTEIVSTTWEVEEQVIELTLAQVAEAFDKHVDSLHDGVAITETPFFTFAKALGFTMKEADWKIISGTGFSKESKLACEKRKRKVT
jgi:hypothetical protein